MIHGDDPVAVAMPGVPLPFRVAAYDALDSTNDTAKSLARNAAAHGLTVWARAQHAGRGRQGREWVSPPGNLYMSVVLRPRIPAIRLGELSFVAAVAVAEAIALSVADPALVSLKWPNDILVDGAKAAGILLESEIGSGGVDWVVCGIGVNLVSAPDGLPYRAAALADFGRPIDSVTMLGTLLRCLSASLHIWVEGGFEPIRDNWRRLGHRPGDRLTVRQGDELLDGRFIDLDKDGGMLVETSTGRVTIAAGDVFPQATAQC